MSNKNDNLQYRSQRITAEIINLRMQLKGADLESERISTQAAIDIKTREYEEILEKISPTEKSPNISKEPIFKRYSIDELESMPPKQWLLDQVFGPGDLGEIYGPSGCGKTFVVIDMIMKICTGGKWAHRFTVNRPMNVAYCAGEGLSALPERFKSGRKHHNNPSLERFSFFKIIPQLFQDVNKNFITIRQFINDWKTHQEKDLGKLDVLFIDTLRRATDGADENSSKDMSDVVNACQLAITELGCAVILIHHTAKSGNTERGSGAVRGAADFMIEIIKPIDSRNNATMHCEKLKDGEEWKDQAFSLGKVEGCESACVHWDEPAQDGIIMKGNEKNRNKILAELDKHENGLTGPSIATLIGESRQQADRLINKLVNEGKIVIKLKNPEAEASRYNPWIYFRQKA